MSPADNLLDDTGGETRRVWAVAWPLILTNVLNAFVGMIDFKMVGELGVSSIAAVGMARQVMMFIMVFMIAISGGASVLVARAYGAADRERVSMVASRSIAFMLFTALLFVMPFGLLVSRPILEMLGGAPHVTDLGTGYLYILFIGVAISMFNFGVTAILIGVGRTRVSLALLIIINVLNVAFNYIFIFGLGPIPSFGVGGAAAGSVLARAVGAVIGIWVLRSPRFPIGMSYKYWLGFDKVLLKKILALGGPRSLQAITRNAARLTVIRILTLLPDSTRVVSAYSVGLQARMLSAFIGLAFMSAAMSRVGYNLGAGKPEQAEKSGWIAARMGMGVMTVMAVIFLIFPTQIMAQFTDDAQVIAMGRVFFLLIAMTEPMMALAFALGGALRGGGDAMTPFIWGSVADLGIVIGLGYILTIPCGLGFTGIAIAMAASPIVRAIPTVWIFQRGKWKLSKL